MLERDGGERQSIAASYQENGGRRTEVRDYVFPAREWIEKPV